MGNRPYPDGIAWDEALRQRQRADNAEKEIEQLKKDNKQQKKTRKVTKNLKQLQEMVSARFYLENEDKVVIEWAIQEINRQYE